MGAHFYPAMYLRDFLLPRGQIIGWCPGTYCGYPLFQFYFPLSFLLMSALDVFVPFAVAFKIVTQLGTFSLPVVTYVSLRLMRVPFPGPALAPLASLCFLFMEANSVWGGNIPSTLAGEFSFSIALSLSILFLGVLFRTMETGLRKLWCAVLMALIVLSHGYAVLWAGLSSMVELIATRAWWRRLGVLAVTHVLAILLTGFFLAQLFGYARWTTVFSHSWLMRTWREVFPPILWPVLGIAVGATLVLLFQALKRRQRFPRALGVLWGAGAMAVFLWLTAHYFHVVDVRFLPFLQLGLCLIAATGLGFVLRTLPAVEIWPLAAGLALFPFVQSCITFIPSWIDWNYSGFETKPGWPQFSAISRHLQGDYRQPRVVYEHSSAIDVLGTVRAFENLPLFAGRSTLEGLYLQGSPTAPFVFFVQSEISKEMSCPFIDYGCSRFDLDRGVEHLRLLNVSHYIVRSAEAKAAAARHAGLMREMSAGPFEVYRVEGNDGRYAVPLEWAPVLVRTNDWKNEAYRWFKRATASDPTPVFVDKVPSDAAEQFGAVVDGTKGALARRAIGPLPELKERLETDRITITGCRAGHPVLVRISYHPRWRATTGEKISAGGAEFHAGVP